MATYQEAAQALADKFAAHEATAMRNFVAHPDAATAQVPIGPITKKTFIRRAQGLEGDIGQLHLDITPFDPRISTQDSGGGK